VSWALADILSATAGRLEQWGPGPFLGVSTDSRQPSEASVFVALSGATHDGHDHVAGAIAAGATAIVVARDVEPPPLGVAWIRVRDGVRALGDLAAYRRRRLAARVVAVTGSNGKTTTKEMIASILAATGASVARTRGTENNLVGLPMTLLRLEGSESFVVLEMGMNRAGEIWRLAEIARPDVGVITNVGPAHLEGLGTLDNVAAAKGELALALASPATLVVNGDDPRLVLVAEGFHGRRLLVSATEGPVRLLSAEPLGDEGQRLVIGIGEQAVVARLRAVGVHNATNAALAAAAACALGVSPDVIAAGLEAFEPPPMRLSRVRLPSGARLWNDAYNANPGSMAAAFDALARERAARRIAVLGEMRELGDEAARWHRDTGEAAARSGIDLLVVVGRFADDTAAGAISAGLSAERVHVAESPEAAAALLVGDLGEGDLVLVKGSRVSRMEDVVRGLEENL
jgi:UDP-N-acetylmuramoyl-tripeptide--D-alanyl-D-alanine ligase